MCTPVSSATDRAALRELLVEYHEWMRTHAGSVYDPDAELAEDFESLDDDEVWAWLAERGGTPCGCVLLYGLSDELAEFKRLWVTPDARGEGVGEALVLSCLETAAEAGYDRMGLTTPPWSTAAHELYESLGFERTGAYPETKLPERYHDGAIFMQRSLADDEEW